MGFSSTQQLLPLLLLNPLLFLALATTFFWR